MLHKQLHFTPLIVRRLPDLPGTIFSEEIFEGSNM